MVNHVWTRPVSNFFAFTAIRPMTMVLAAIVFVTACIELACAESTMQLVVRPTATSEPAATQSEPALLEPLRDMQSIAPVDDSAYVRLRSQSLSRQVNFQTPFADDPVNSVIEPDPSAGPRTQITEVSLRELGVNIAMPPDTSPPINAAGIHWLSINQSAGPLAGQRCWSSSVYNWDATCLCHRPLYFEQINLERHGYGCCECLQPAASAAHFFATVPALPYCMAVECPCECVYTLGHYRPGSCPPKRYHWPPCSPLAAAAEGGVWTGLIFLIP